MPPARAIRRRRRHRDGVRTSILGRDAAEVSATEIVINALGVAGYRPSAGRRPAPRQLRLLRSVAVRGSRRRVGHDRDASGVTGGVSRSRVGGVAPHPTIQVAISHDAEFAGLKAFLGKVVRQYGECPPGPTGTQLPSFPCNSDTGGNRRRHHALAARPCRGIEPAGRALQTLSLRPTSRRPVTVRGGTRDVRKPRTPARRSVRRRQTPSDRRFAVAWPGLQFGGEPGPASSEPPLTGVGGGSAGTRRASSGGRDASPHRVYLEPGGGVYAGPRWQR